MFLRKLKFNYLEQNAKDKYIKYIVDDDSQLVTNEDNDTLRRSNDEKKAKLKAAKNRLAQQYVAVAEKASAVEKSTWPYYLHTLFLAPYVCLCRARPRRRPRQRIRITHRPDPRRAPLPLPPAHRAPPLDSACPSPPPTPRSNNRRTK